MFWCEMCVHVIVTRDRQNKRWRKTEKLSFSDTAREAMHGRDNREENGKKGETREQNMKHKGESLWHLVTQRVRQTGQMGKRDSNWEKGRNREWGIGRQRQDRQKGHRAWKGYVCAEKRKVKHIKQVWHRKIVWCHILKLESEPFLGSWSR